MTKFIDTVLNKMLGRQRVEVTRETADWIAVMESCDDYEHIEECWAAYKLEGFTYDQMQKVGAAYCKQAAKIIGRMIRNNEPIPGVRGYNPDEYHLRVDKAYQEINDGTRRTGRYR